LEERKRRRLQRELLKPYGGNNQRDEQSVSERGESEGRGWQEKG
jgi:hypothetical protein